MNGYSPERKEALLKKLLPPYNLTVTEVSKEEGISTTSLYHWRKQARLEGVPVPGSSRLSKSWSGEAKFAVVLATATLSAAELSQYCREKGLYPEQVKSWKQDCVDAASASVERQRQEQQQSKTDRKRILQLEKELRRKEKALAEAAALLVLRKKLNAFYGEELGDG
jgi:transposase-like protein